VDRGHEETLRNIVQIASVAESGASTIALAQVSCNLFRALIFLFELATTIKHGMVSATDVLSSVVVVKCVNKR
jgi:hypothetical protein